MSAKLGEILVRENLISPQHLREALDYQREHGGRLGFNLVRRIGCQEPQKPAAQTYRYHANERGITGEREQFVLHRDQRESRKMPFVLRPKGDEVVGPLHRG